jgi:hypothetical protein
MEAVDKVIGQMVRNGARNPLDQGRQHLRDHRSERSLNPSNRKGKS